MYIVLLDVYLWKVEYWRVGVALECLCCAGVFVLCWNVCVVLECLCCAGVFVLYCSVGEKQLQLP